jgi:hypothetical protein
MGDEMTADAIDAYMRPLLERIWEKGSPKELYQTRWSSQLRAGAFFTMLGILHHPQARQCYIFTRVLSSVWLSVSRFLQPSAFSSMPYFDILAVLGD